MSDEASTIIVGGGIAGLATAREMRRHGLAVGVLERRARLGSVGFAVNLPGNAIEALAAMGLRDAIEATGRPIGRREYRNARDRLLFEVDEDAFWGAATLPRAVRRAALVAILRDGLDDAVIRHEADVASVSLDGDRPTVRLGDGTALAADLVVGADGVGSAVRRGLSGGGDARRHAVLSRSSWRFLATNPGIDCWTVWAGSRGVVLLMPLDGDEVYGWATAMRGDDAGSVDALAALAGDFPERARRAIDDAVSRPGAILHSPLEETRPASWSGPGAVLIGDAAHAMAPVWAEGVALALEDAIVLPQCLSANASLQDALTAFERRRRVRVDHVRKMTDAMSKAARVPPLIRDLLMPRIGPKRYRQTYAPLKTPI